MSSTRTHFSCLVRRCLKTFNLGNKFVLLVLTTFLKYRSISNTYPVKYIHFVMDVPYVE
uniref:Uncharacterized protein n=1 Tax=Castor canadensis TaxID=51338 RepID=A0A8C0W2Q2_CASCN